MKTGQAPQSSTATEGTQTAPGRRSAASRRWRLLAGAVLAAVCSVCSGAAADGAEDDRSDAPAPAAPRSGAKELDDVQDLLFLGPLRPVAIRLHIAVNGQPFRKAWRDNIHKLFLVADVNRNGAIDMEQPPESADGTGKRKLAEIDVFATSAAAYLGQEAAQAQTSLRQLAGEQGGALSESALVAYFERVAPPFAIVSRAESQRGYAIGMTPAPALLPLLDVNGDQALSRDELDSAEQRLANRDFNEDEVISPRELMVAPDASLAAAEQPQTQRPSALAGVDPLFLLARDEKPERVAAALLERYDADGDERLSTGAAGEIDLHAERLRRLDADGDAQLSRLELAAFAQQGPDVELTHPIGGRTYIPKTRRNKLVQLAAPEEDRISVKTLHNGFEASLADATIRIQFNQRDPTKNNPDGPDLSNFDSDANGYLEADEVKDNPGLSAAFVSLDLDRDGKLFSDEFQMYADREKRAAASRLLLEVTDGGQQLLNVLDAASPRDSVLSVRELRSAAAALERSDRNGDGRLAGSEIPRQVRMDVSRNTPAGARVANARQMAETPEGLQAAPAGPPWFQKLDRNRDGDLSRREFVGPEEIFLRLDANHDGLIDASEAEAAKK